MGKKSADIAILIADNTDFYWKTIKRDEGHDINWALVDPLNKYINIYIYMYFSMNQNFNDWYWISQVKYFLVLNNYIILMVKASNQHRISALLRT